MQFKFKLSLAFVCNIPYKYGFHYNELIKKIEWEMKPFRPLVPWMLATSPNHINSCFLSSHFCHIITNFYMISNHVNWALLESLHSHNILVIDGFHILIRSPCQSSFIIYLLLLPIFNWKYYLFILYIGNFTCNSGEKVIQSGTSTSIGLMLMIMPCILPT